MITYQVESFTDCIEEMSKLFDEHCDEVSSDPENIRPNIDYDAYFRLEDIGSLHLITVRKDEELVGYNLYLISPLLHYKHIIHATNDAIFIKKEHRKGTVGFRLIKFAINTLKERGIYSMMIHTKTKVPFDRLCERLGMTFAEKTYTLVLGDK